MSGTFQNLTGKITKEEVDEIAIKAKQQALNERTEEIMEEMMQKEMQKQQEVPVEPQREVQVEVNEKKFNFSILNFAGIATLIVLFWYGIFSIWSDIGLLKGSITEMSWAVESNKQEIARLTREFKSLESLKKEQFDLQLEIKEKMEAEINDLKKEELRIDHMASISKARYYERKQEEIDKQRKDILTGKTEK